MSKDAFFALGLLAGLMIAAWGLGRKAFKSKHYDEMQLKIRATGYRIGFFTALALMAVLMLLFELDCLGIVSPAFALLAVLMVSITVFAVYCIRHEAFLSVDGQGKRYIALFTLVVLCNGLTSALRLIRGEALENGRLTLSFGSPLLMTVAFLVILAALLIKTVKAGKEAAE